MSQASYEAGRTLGLSGKGYAKPSSISDGRDKDDFDSGYNDTKAQGTTDKADAAEAALMAIPETAPVDYEAMYSAMANMYGKMSATNEATFNKYWPESLGQGIAAGQVFDSASRSQADTMNNWLGQMTSTGNQYMRGEAGQMNQWMMGQVGDVNKFNSDEFYKALNKAMPGIMDTAANYKGTVDQMLSGQLPDSVKNEIAQAGAERGLSSGTYGPSLDNAQIRDLGLNRLQYLQAGQAQVGNLINIAGALTAPVATPNIYQNVMMTPTPYAPTLANTAGIAGNYLSAIMGQTMMQPAAGIGAATQMGGVSAQINMANTQLQYSKAMSVMNMGMDQQALAQEQSQYESDMRYANQNQTLANIYGGVGAAGTAWGAILGGGGKSKSK